MILGVPHHHHLLPHPTDNIPPWPLIDDLTDESSPTTPFGGYLLSPPPDPDTVPDSSACDDFRIYEFKVRLCARGRSHDWTDCPFAHPGEKARRRDPRKFQYSGTSCPDFLKGACRMGDACEFAHGVFECWLHPTRYRTQPCKDGINCRRKVCFFAHSADQLRAMTPPMSPVSEVGALAAAFRGLRFGKVKSIPSSLGGQLSLGVSHGFISLPAMPTQMMARMGFRVWTAFIGRDDDEGEPVMERVESGRDLRARMFERIRKGGRLDPVGPDKAPVADCPDVGWVSDLVR